MAELYSVSYTRTSFCFFVDCTLVIMWMMNSENFTNVSTICVSAYAFAELIDNALAATAQNVGSRNIEIKLVSWSKVSIHFRHQSSNLLTQ